MDEFLRSSAGSSSLVIAIPIALLAGLVSFFSPCVIPLLPGYLSYATGLSGADIASGAARRGRMLAGALLFVLGFTVAFIIMGAVFGAAGSWLLIHQRLVSSILGVVSIVLGLAFLGLVPWLQRDIRVHRVPAVGLAAAPLLGFLFGVGWSPCVGPTLGGILTLAVNEGTPGRGALLLGFYSLGLGLPFIVAALAWQRSMVAFGFLRRHMVWITRIGGVMMILVGVLLVTGWWDYLVTWLQVQLAPFWQVGL
jgi:cytochrome c-type biogenesis protein